DRPQCASLTRVGSGIDQPTALEIATMAAREPRRIWLRTPRAHAALQRDALVICRGRCPIRDVFGAGQRGWAQEYEFWGQAASRAAFGCQRSGRDGSSDKRRQA